LFLPTVICRRHGITAAQLRYRREMEGWLSARARVPKQADLVARMLKVLDKQIRRLEAAVDEPIDKQVKALSESVKTLDTLIKNGASKPNVEPATRKDMTDLRAKLVKRFEQSAR
jgi:recombinational DNA repair ATPase RecF